VFNEKSYRAASNNIVIEKQFEDLCWKEWLMKTLKQKFRYLKEEINYSIRPDGLEVNSTTKNLMILAFEGVRKVLSCEVLSTESEGVSQLGLGYVILKTNNNQKVQGEGICWRIIFASFIKKVDLEAGLRADCNLKGLTEEFWVVLSIIISFDSEGVSFVSSYCKKNPQLNETFGYSWFSKKFSGKRFKEEIYMLTSIDMDIEKELKEMIWAEIKDIMVMVVTKMIVLSKKRLKHEYRYIEERLRVVIV
jgi:hypothetical protein